MTAFFTRIGATFGRWFAPIRRWYYWMYTIHHRESRQLLQEATQMRELMPLLMKQRNGYRWTKEDRAQIRSQLLRLKGLSPYLIPLLLPGGFLMLPVLSWWMDRRRQQRKAETEAQKASVK
jgi:hypothetical protein